jgi:4-oxalocrotonate tautomerase
MPLVRITLAQGRDAEYRRAIADGVQQALVEIAGVPPADRFQVIHEVPSGDFFWSPDYLGIHRTEAVVFIQVFLNHGRSVEVKQALYERIAEKLKAAPGIRPEDVLVNLVEVARENWSFGNGQLSYSPAP